MYVRLLRCKCIAATHKQLIWNVGRVYRQKPMDTYVVQVDQQDLRSAFFVVLDFSAHIGSVRTTSFCS
jgi:hypothetical protein